MLNKLYKLIILGIPAVVMIALIPFVQNDYLLTLIYLGFIGTSLFTKWDIKDFIALLFGFFVITFFEYIFVATGIETFSRRTLLGVMPLWLPVLWGYGFILIKRSIIILDK